MCSGTSRNSDEGGASLRSTSPNSTKPGSTREACATLTPDRRAMVRRFSSAVVSASTASTRPCTPGMTASTGRTKSISADYLTSIINRTLVSYMSSTRPRLLWFGLSQVSWTRILESSCDSDPFSSSRVSRTGRGTPSVVIDAGYGSVSIARSSRETTRNDGSGRETTST